ncbi:DNA-processing protein DprA [Treponema primitia]|uniref:DNA-processing protein DprA n=1 Tax=Treponema primitia TaxID=88058 RepID=UPI003980B076
MDKRGLLDLVINRIPHLGPREKIVLGEKFDREEDFYVLSKEDIEQIVKRPLNSPWTMDALRVQAERDANAGRLRGIDYISHGDSKYPPLLRELFDPPALLFYRGVLPNPEQTMTAVVGTRRPSGRAAAQAYDMGRELARGGMPVVSGLALGIDALAHRGNMDGGAPTAAVLGSGLDQVYPVSNRALARRILETGGVLLSEYPPGTEPFRWNFPARNRIISGLARGVLIVEAPKRSGALITAQFALDQGRDLFVASAGVSSPLGAGTKKLAEDGARVIVRAAEIFEEWGMAYPEDTRNATGTDLALSLGRSLNIVCEE